MPHYDYQGKVYEIETDDPDQARAKIQAYLNAQPSEGTPEQRLADTATDQFATGVAQELITPDMASKAIGSAAKGVGTVASLPIRAAKDVTNVARNMFNVTGSGLQQMVEHPYLTAKAYAAGSPTLGPIYNAGAKLANQSINSVINQGIDYAKALPGYAKALPGKIPSMAGTVGRGVAAGVLAPENVMLAPYTMAGYEMEKIRQNPTSPEYATNPYAQTVRGEYATQGQAGAANRRNAQLNQPTPAPLTPQEATNLLQSGDQRTIDIYGGAAALQQIATGQAVDVMSQPPNAMNFLGRVKELSKRYNSVGN